MTACVSETSYYLIFASALVVSVLLLISSAFSYDKFKHYNVNPEDATDKGLNSAVNISIAFFIAGLLSVSTLFVLFFGFQKRLLGVSTTVSK